jgi:hypothetical protein
MKSPEKKKHKFDVSSILKHWDERNNMKKEHFTKTESRKKGQKKLELDKL